MVFVVGPSVAVTVMLYVPGMVAGVIVSVAEPDLVVSATEVAVTVTLAGRPAATVGAIYRPVALIDPQGLGVAVHDVELLKLQVTAVLLVFVTVAVNCAC